MNTTLAARAQQPFALFLFVLVSLIVMLAGCGGGGGDDAVAPPPAPSEFVRIDAPTSGDTYQTDRDMVLLEGVSFVPDGSSCPSIVGVLPAGYDVTWTNNTTGSSGGTSFYLGCLLQVHVIWESYPIPLVMGANTITVKATDAAGHVATDTLVVTRVPDVTAPHVASASPVDGASSVPVNTSVTFIFNEEMDPASIDASTVTLRDNVGNLVPASVSYLGYSLSAKLSPTSLLTYNTLYHATVTTNVKDAAGNPLAAPYAVSFTTGANPDITPPSVQSVSPSSGSYCASPSGAVTAIFSEELDPATVDGTTFTLTAPGNQAMAGTVSYLSLTRTATFTPAAALPLSTAFNARLTTGIKDLAGNLLAAPYEWSFTTASSQSGSWTPTSVTNVPFARYGHAAVWTGSEMIVSGGLAWDTDWSTFDYTPQYGRYSPATGTWNVASGAPAGMFQKAVWTGSRMLVFGGYREGTALTGGAAYDPGTGAWTALSTTGQPSARYDHTAVWTGSEMVVWGGRIGSGSMIGLGNGARYNPATNTWQPISMTGAPSPRYGHTAVWTGSAMIVWGGANGSSILGDGARYDPASDTWTPVGTTGAPSERLGHMAVWTGNEMIVWGGLTNTGGIYSPASDSWHPTDTTCAPSARSKVPAVWTGSRMILWGPADGYAFDPAGNVWQQVAALGAPSTRSEHSMVWTGSKAIVWGGTGNGLLNSGGLLTP